MMYEPDAESEAAMANGTPAMEAPKNAAPLAMPAGSSVGRCGLGRAITDR